MAFRLYKYVTLEAASFYSMLFIWAVQVCFISNDSSATFDISTSKKSTQQLKHLTRSLSIKCSEINARCQVGACLHWFLLLILDMLDITHTDATERLWWFLIGWLVAWPDSDWSKVSHCEDCSWCQWLVSETRSHCRSVVDVEFEFSLTPRMNRRQQKKCFLKGPTYCQALVQVLSQ